MTKKILFTLFVALFIPHLAMTQDTIMLSTEKQGTNKPFLESIADCIEPLDKSLITSGLLSDKVIPFVSLDQYDGQTDSVITFGQWKQVYRQLYHSSISEPDMPVPEDLKDSLDSHLHQGVIPIVILNMKYHQIKPYALDSNLIYLNDGKLYDVNGRLESPYEEKRLFAATTFTNTIGLGQVSFKIDNHFYLSNTNETLSSFEINYGDGRGFVNIPIQSGVINNRIITVNYSQTGTKNLIVRITLSNNVVLFSKLKVVVKDRSTISYDDSFRVTGYVPFNGSYGHGTAYVYYGCGNNHRLRKPIIVSDGFDPNGTNIIDSLYNMLNKEDFLENARQEGFDFVILDYDKGADYIQRNAFVMVSLINQVNEQLRNNGSDAELTIIGPSMGGLITRYALSYMEQNNINHNTHSYVSFDSPHLGANIPLGDQLWIDFFATEGKKDAAIEAKAILDTPAAKQMLIYHYSSQLSPTILRMNLLNDPYFQFPTQCRRIGIANGSGESQIYFEPGEQMIEYRYLLGLVKGNTWALPARNGGRQMIFEGSIVKFDWDLYVSLKVYVQGTYPYDGAPGGGRNVNEVIADGDTGGYGDITTDYPIVCFIPIVSSLCLQNVTDVNCNVHNITGYPHPSSNASPFDVIYAPDTNEYHVDVTLANIGWILDELGVIDLNLQNRVVNSPKVFEARHSILVGKNVTSNLPTGNFVVQNDSGDVLLRCEGTIQLRDGTHLKPLGTGMVNVSVSEFLCSSSWLPENSLGRNTEIDEKQPEEQTYTEMHESIAPTSSEKLPRSYPNPCSDYTTIEYELEKNAKVEIDVYNLMGVKMFTVEDRQNMGAGRYTTTVNTSSLSTGMYIGVVRANGETNGVLKMQVMK